jgi:uncharacterized protein
MLMIYLLKFSKYMIINLNPPSMKKSYLIAIFFTAVFFYGCKEKVAEYKPNYSTPPFIIDTHLHYRANDAWEKSFLEIYTKRNAMACVFVGMNDLDRGIAFAKAHPDRMIPYAAIDIDSPTILEDVQKVYDMGFKGLGEIFAKGDWSYNDKKYEPLWTLAEKLHMPVAPHTGNLANGLMDHLRPAPLADVTARHPGLFVHAAHFGNPWYEEAAEATRRNSNLYFDLCGSSLIKKENDPGYWAQWLWWTDAIGKAHMPKNAVPAWKKIMFATDETPDQLEENIRRFNKALDANKVPDSIRLFCWYKTMAKVHGIEVKTTK